MEILDFLSNFSWEVLVVSVILFILTMFVKWPIKKATSKLAENKRKAINSVIIAIPVILSFVITPLFFGIVKNEWFSVTIIENAVTSCLLSISIFVVYQRIIIVIKGFTSGKQSFDNQIICETINTIKNDINSLNTVLKNDKSKLKEISNKILYLLNIKKEIEKSNDYIDLKKLSETNTQIQSLTNEETKLEEQINITKNQITQYELKLQQEKSKNV